LNDQRENQNHYNFNEGLFWVLANQISLTKNVHVNEKNAIWS